MRLLQERAKLFDADFRWLALALNGARVMHPFFLTAWVFPPDHWHAIGATVYPLTVSLVMKSVKTSSIILMNRRRAESGELWEARFPSLGSGQAFDRGPARREEYNGKVEYIHLNPARAGLEQHPQDWRWSGVNEYSGVSAAEQKQRCGLTIDRVRMPSDPRTRIDRRRLSVVEAQAADLNNGGPRYRLPAQTSPHIYLLPLADSTGQFREVWASPDGKFSLGQIPPGDYQVLAFDRPQPELEYRNEEAMRKYDSREIRLLPGQNLHLQLHMILGSE